ncbi:MAG: SDR family oxidoreductase, partial [Myxococcota bacterium]
VLAAGIHADAAFPAMSGEAWDSVLRTNLDGFYNVLRPLVMPLVRLHDGGRIVALSSVAGIAGNRGQVNYAASKAGLHGAAKSLAHELAKREITVNCIAPGLIDTEMLAGAPVAELAKLVPMQRLGRPDEIASLVVYLFSEGAGYITGQVISVNGGML